MTQRNTCGLSGCTNPIDPDSFAGRCTDCTVEVEAAVLRAVDADRQRRAQVTGRAPVDALLIARAFLRGDQAATAVLLKHADAHSTTLQLAGWLRTALDTALAHGAGHEFGDHTVDDVLARWLTQVTQEAAQ